MEWQKTYPLTDLDTEVPKLEKVETIETKKPPPLWEAVVCLGSVCAMEINENPCENSN